MSSAEALRRCPDAVFLRPRHASTASTRERSGRPSARSCRASSEPASTRATSTSARCSRSFSGARRLAEAVQVAVRGARRSPARSACRPRRSSARSPRTVASRAASPSCRRAGGALPRAASRAAPARRRPARRGAARRCGCRHDRRSRGALRRRAPRGAPRPGRGVSCATGRAASTRATSSSTRSGSRSPPRRRSSATSPTGPALHAELRRMATEVAAIPAARRPLGAHGDDQAPLRRLLDPLALDDAADADRRAGADRRPRLPLLDRGLRDRPGALRLVGVGVSGLTAVRQLTLDEL